MSELIANWNYPTGIRVGAGRVAGVLGAVAGVGEDLGRSQQDREVGGVAAGHHLEDHGDLGGATSQGPDRVKRRAVCHQPKA